MASLGYKGTKVFVYGMGKSGCATIAALYADGAEVYVYDNKPLDELMQNNNIQKLMNKSTIYFADDGDVHFEDFSGFFKAPGIDMHEPLVQKAKQAGLDILGDVDLLYKREPHAQFIGITGTNGKSTTTALIGHIMEKAGLKVAVGGNLGTAMLNLPKDQDFYVLELSSYQLETMHEMKINHAVFLNLTPDHLLRHGDMVGYLEAKKRIFSKDDGVHVLGIDNEVLEKFSASGNFQTVSVDGKEALVQVSDKGLLSKGGKAILDLTKFKHLPGQHNWQNLACAYLILKDIVSLTMFKKGVQSYKNLPHRMEKVAEFENIQFYNDSKATNPESAIRALESFDHIFWICGGQLKADGMKPCINHLKHVECAFVIGADTKVVVKDLEVHVQTFDCKSMEEAVYGAWKQCKKLGLTKATILLSPACASWDQYESFEHRGDVFVSLCHELISRLQVDS